MQRSTLSAQPISHLVAGLHDNRPLSPTAAGTHASELAVAARAGLAVAHGAVLTVEAVEHIRSFGLPTANYLLPGSSEGRGPTATIVSALRSQWHQAARSGLLSVDLMTSPVPGSGLTPQTVGTGIADWTGYLHALRRTIAATPTDVEIAILAQRQVDLAETGTARMRRGPWRSIDIGPATINDGPTDCWSRLGAFGRLVRASPNALRLDREHRRRLAAMVRSVDPLFVENTAIVWGLDPNGWFWLRRVLQGASQLPGFGGARSDAAIPTPS